LSFFENVVKIARPQRRKKQNGNLKWEGFLKKKEFFLVYLFIKKTTFGGGNLILGRIEISLKNQD